MDFLFFVFVALVLIINLKRFQVKSIPEDTFLVVRKGHPTKCYEHASALNHYVNYCRENEIDGYIYQLKDGIVDYVSTIRSFTL